MLLHYIDTAWADKPKIKVNDSCYTPSLETSRTTEMILLKRHNNFNCFFISFQPVGLSFGPVFPLSHPIILAIHLGFLMDSKQLSFK